MAAIEIPPGNAGNLTEEQEAKLRQLWATIFKLYDLYNSTDPDVQAAIQNCHKLQEAPAQKSRFWGGGKKAEENKDAAIIEKALNLGAADEHDKFGLRKQFMEMLGKHTVESVRSMIIETTKMDHPDALALRFLRARKWEVDKGAVMMLAALDWRRNKFKVDADIMKHGEGQAIIDEKSTDPKVRELAAGFLRQLRMGKGFIHHTDKKGRPISYVRVKLHRASDAKAESLERFIVFLIETGRICLEPPVETACLLFDMTGFTLANLDYVPIKFIIQSFEANYPESLGTILIHNAPWVFKSVWKIIHGWLDPVVAGKVNFTNGVTGPEGLENFIDLDKLSKEVGGSEDFVFKYTEPVEGEDELMKDTATRDKLLAERDTLGAQFEAATRKWLAEPEGAQGEAHKAERDGLAKEMRANYWKLDPYVRARSVYDRQGNILGGGVTSVWSDADVAAARNGGVEAATAAIASLKTDDTFVDASADQVVTTAPKGAEVTVVHAEKAPAAVAA